MILIPFVRIAFLPLLLLIATFHSLQILIYADDTDDDTSSGACRMEMKFFNSFDTCYDDPIATAFVYADGQCHTVETDVSTSDSLYDMMPGNYRAECSTNDMNEPIVIFMDSACTDGSCSQASTCNRDDTIAGSLFSIVRGQSVQNKAEVGDFYQCEQVYNDQHSIIFAIFGDCSLPGCSVDGVVNPTDPSSPSPTDLPNEPPTSPTTAPVEVPDPSTSPSASPVETPTTRTPIVAPTIVTTPAPITASPITKQPTTAAPITAAPITVAPVALGEPTVSPTVPRPTTTSPTSSPTIVETTEPTLSPIKAVIVPPSSTMKPVNNVTEESTSSTNNNNGIIFGAVGGIALVAMILLFGLVQRHRTRYNKNGGAVGTTTTEKSKEVHDSHTIVAPNDKPVTTTNEIWFDPNHDDVSTLDGGTMPDINTSRVYFGDEHTASVNNDYDYNENRYRNSGDERSRFTSSTSPTAFTSLSKLGIIPPPSAQSITADDDISFEQQYATDNDEEVMTAFGSMIKNNSWDHKKYPMHTFGNTINPSMSHIASRVRPFEVRAPPGMLGMVIDTPNNGVPVIRAIKPDSVLRNQIMIGDRLISVNQQNVTNMTALEVSNLITQHHTEERFFVFCRLAPPPPITTTTSPS